ncbi:hypothetical protein [Allopontixanthobacter sp.]|uniref:hypothetical protein n=1 Tax=Allopontixanthobacter sp. TaxID=2906452 RepID=UPI002AB868F9|nr:hypothetical protein [Allopontixanthobacter sp.]MDZ4308378.1 hypothetical protein [Allopontixanthobacter sp.]
MGFFAQFLASLAAILVLAWVSHWMELGRGIRIRDAAHAQALADEVVCGFAAEETVIDETGKAALLRDRNGRIVLIKLHGAQFSGRLLGPGSGALLRNDGGRPKLEINPGERLFGTQIIDIERPEDWVHWINAAKAPHHYA